MQRQTQSLPRVELAGFNLSGGNGYDSANPPSVTISSATGAGATAFATVNATGEVSGITMVNLGAGYVTATVVIAEPRIGARYYTPLPDDGFLDIGEKVHTEYEVLLPKNYAGFTSSLSDLMPEVGLVLAVQFDMAKFVNIDRDTPMLLPPDMRDWVPSSHLVHFMIDAIESVDTSMAQINHRGTGSKQYPPAMLLTLLVYSYCTGMFSSRQIERSSHTDVAVRFVCANTHPDHDTICTFRRNNGALLHRAFAQILEMAAQCGVLKVGQVTVAIDGTKVLANASKHAAVSYGYAEQKLNDLDMEIKELLVKAEQADSTPLQDGLTIPDEVQRREERQAALRRAKVEMEARAYARFQAESAQSKGSGIDC